MKMNTQLPSHLLRVFFILVIIAIGGIGWQALESQKTEVKAIGGTYREGMIGAPRFINPVLAQSQADRDIAKLVYTPIVSIDKEGSVHYQAAENIERSDDGKIYTVSLRDDINFQDGEELTSEDVVFTIETIQDPQIKSPLAAQWEGISATAIDDETVTFTLSQAYNDFLYNLEVGILPKHIWENVGPQEFIFSTHNTFPIGSGPYRVESSIEQENGTPERYTLIRSEDYFEKSYLRKIQLYFFENEQALIKGITAGIIDGAYGVSPESISNFSEDRYEQGVLPRIFGLFFNQSKQPLLASTKIRQAIGYGINKNKIINDIFSGFASPISSPLGIIEEVNTYNPQRATELIESEGWRRNNDGYYAKIVNGKTVELGFSIAIPNLEDMTKVAEHIQNDLANIGIRVAIRSYDQGNLSQNIIRERDYESLLFGYEIKKPSDLYAFWHSSQVSDPGLNISLFSNNKVDQALDTIRSQSIDGIAEVDALITQSQPAVFLYAPSYVYLIPRSIQHPELSITTSEDRFDNIEQWYNQTRKVWNSFIENENSNQEQNDD